jgi:hypothetical protein
MQSQSNQITLMEMMNLQRSFWDFAFHLDEVIETKEMILRLQNLRTDYCWPGDCVEAILINCRIQNLPMEEGSRDYLRFITIEKLKIKLIFLIQAVARRGHALVIYRKTTYDRLDLETAKAYVRKY